MARTKMAISLRTAIVGSVVAGAVGIAILPLAAGYAVLIVPMDLISFLGPLSYFALVSLLAGTAVGILAGGSACALLRDEGSRAFAAIAVLAAALYLTFAAYARGVVGPGWWTPWADAVAFVAAFICTALAISRRRRAHAI